MSESRSYETTYIMNAALEDAEIEAAILRVNTFIGEHGGKIREENKWGRRRLAYPIGKKYNGYYVHLVFEIGADILPALERFFMLEESVIRHLSLQLDEKLHAFRKVRAEAQAARAAQMAAEGGRPERAERSERPEKSENDFARNERGGE